MYVFVLFENRISTNCKNLDYIFQYLILVSGTDSECTYLQSGWGAIEDGASSNQ